MPYWQSLIIYLLTEDSAIFHGTSNMTCKAHNFRLDTHGRTCDQKTHKVHKNTEASLLHLLRVEQFIEMNRHDNVQRMHNMLHSVNGGSFSFVLTVGLNWGFGGVAIEV